MAQDDDLTVLRWQMESEMTIEDIRGICPQLVFLERLHAGAD